MENKTIPMEHAAADETQLKAELPAVEAYQLDRVDSNSTFSSFPSTRRSSLTAASLEQASSLLSHRSSQSSLQSAPPITPADLYDVKLQQICADEQNIKSDFKSKYTLRPDPFAEFRCAFGFTGKLDNLIDVPATKKLFLEALTTESRACGFIQQGLTSYITAINSGEHHTFGEEFLANQNGAADETIKQLDVVKKHLDEITGEVNDVQFPEDDDAEVVEELRKEFQYARPWIQRTRAVLVSAHVFYKINYVLASDKKH